MGNNNKDSLRVHPKDSNSIAREKNEKLLEIIRRLEKNNRKIKSQYKTMEDAWHKTEEKYKEAVKDIPLQEIVEHVQSGKQLTLKNRSSKRQCSKCKSGELKKTQFDGFHVVVCGKCGYRNRVDDNTIK